MIDLESRVCYYGIQYFSGIINGKHNLLIVE